MTVATDDMAPPEPAGHAPGPIAEVAEELEWAFRERRGWLAGFAFNVVVAAAFVFYEHVDAHQHDRLRVAGIATGVAAWVLADGVNTDQLGSDARRTLDALGRNQSIVRILAKKNLMLATLLAPVAIVISTATRLSIDHWRDIPHTVLLDLFVVFMWLGIGDIVSVLFPTTPSGSPSGGTCAGVGPVGRSAWPSPTSSSTAGVSGWLHWPAATLPHAFGPADRHLFEWAFGYLCWGLLVWIAGLAFAAAYVHLTGDRLERSLTHRR